MKRLRLLLLLTVLMSMVGMSVSAHDFELDGIYYSYGTGLPNADHSPYGEYVRVTFQGAAYDSYSNEYSGEVVIPPTVTYNDRQYYVVAIAAGAFYDCSGLTSIDIPNTVTRIGSGEFMGCSGLTSITVAEGNTVYDSRDNCNALIETASNKLIAGCQNTVIPNSVTSISNSAFSGCSGLTSIDIPNSVTDIESFVFKDCSSLKRITIGESLTSFMYNAFEGCSGLTNIQVAIDNETYDSRNDCNAIIETASNKLVRGCQNTVIPNSVTSIGSFAFRWSSSLTSINIPNSVTSIGVAAFEDCSSLTSIDIPNTVTSIGSGAFRGCSGLTSIDIPNSVTSIDAGVFYGCSGLRSVNIPNSVTSIGVGIGGGAFQDCSSLTSIDIPNSVTSIGSRAFQGCSSLTSIYIPNTVTSIDYLAFSGCSGLTSVIVMWETPIDIKYRWDESVFYGINCGQVTLYVPYGCKDAYLAADYWKNFNVVELSSQQLIDITGISLDSSSLTFNAYGQTATLTPIITPADATFKNVVWFSSNTDVANVDNNGVVTAVGNGSAVITAKTTDGTNLTAQCSVTVDIHAVSITIATNSGSAREAIGYSSEYGLDFTNVTDVKAYVATGFTDDGDVLLSRIYIVPDNTGVYLKSVAGAGITVTVPTTAKYVLYANLLKPYIGTGTLAASETIDGVTYKNYVVGTKDGKPSFAIWGGGTFGPHKAYMPIPESLVPAAARAGGFSVKYIDEEPTAIEETIGYSTPASDILYDLQGRKVSNAKRGIYVRNGKKIFIK